MVVFVAVLLWAVFARDTDAGPPRQYYTVRAGDTLWSIADAKFAGDPREGVWSSSAGTGCTGRPSSPASGSRCPRQPLLI